MPELTPEQQRALEVLDWLYDPAARREGRTTVVAISLIRLALRNPGMQVAVQDPTTPYLGRATARNVNRALRDHVIYFVSNDANIMPHWRGELLMRPEREPALEFTPPVRAPALWLPSGWSPPTDSASRPSTVDRHLHALLGIALDSVARLHEQPEPPPTSTTLWERLEGD